MPQGLVENQHIARAIRQMGNPTPSLTKTVYITNRLGLHARAAAKIAKLAGRASAGVWLKKDMKKVDASSIIDILTLAAGKDSQITICIDNPLDMEILDAIEKMVEKGFGE